MIYRPTHEFVINKGMGCKIVRFYEAQKLDEWFLEMYSLHGNGD